MPISSSIARSPEAVFIGGSVGAIEALQVLLPALPAGTPARVVVVVHLPAQRPSLLATIFAGGCALPVREAEDKAPIDPGVVHVAPPDYHLLVSSSRFSLSVDPPVHGSRPSIDVLFESGAWAFGAGALAIALTGASQDGAAGLAAVARAEGQAWVLSPPSGVGDELPRAAVRLCPQARAFSLPAMAAALRDLCRAPLAGEEPLP
jgi:two-component system, chemotaxis family, protein-glutamate methylesterase/glutaminase